jgi:hypothetical protein
VVSLALGRGWWDSGWPSSGVLCRPNFSTLTTLYSRGQTKERAGVQGRVARLTGRGPTEGGGVGTVDVATAKAETI